MRKIITLLPLLIWLFLAACDTKSEREAAEDIREDSLIKADSASRTQEKGSSEQVEFRTRTERELDSLQTRLKDLDNANGKGGGKKKAEWQDTKTKLNARMDRIKMQLEQAGDRSEANWEDLKSDVNKSMDSLRADWKKNVPEDKADIKKK